MAQVKRGHHTVPQFYLDAFANDDHHLGVVRLSSEKKFQQSTRDATVLRDFYNIDSRADPNAIENLISEIEGGAAAVFRKVIVDQDWPLDSNERAILATFFGLQRVRGPNERQLVDEIAKVIASEMESAADTDTSTAADTDQLTPKVAHIKSMLDIQQYAPYYFARTWRLVRFDRKRLLTCDAPVSLLPYPEAPADGPVGIGTAWLILFPMSRTVGIIMSANMIDQPAAVASGQTDVTMQGSAYLADLFNEATISNARESIFHHPDDESLIPAELPARRDKELDTSHRAAESDDGGAVRPAE